MRILISSLLESDRNIHIYTYGGPGEKEYLDMWQKEFEGKLTNYAGHQSLADDVASMANLNLMISMDSSNAHISSLVGIRCISIWGNTHPYAGFWAFNQRVEDAIQLDLECRPCSVYGRGECKYGDYRCMNNLQPETIKQYVLSIIGNPKRNV